MQSSELRQALAAPLPSGQPAPLRRAAETGSHSAYTSPEPRPAPWQLLARLDWHTNLASRFGATNDVVLLYHSVGGVPGTEYRWDLPTDVFREQIRAISRRYEVVDLGTLVTEPDVDRKRVAVTFDDGFRNVATDAVPILRDFDVPATMFLCPEYIGDANVEGLRERHGLPSAAHDIVMTDSQVQALADDDLFSLGNHTQSHPNLTDLDTPAAVRSEIVGGQAALADRFGVTVDRFSYPYGARDERAASVVESTHDIAVTSVPNLVGSDADAHRLPRLDGCQPAPVLTFEMSDLAHRLRTLTR